MRAVDVELAAEQLDAVEGEDGFGLGHGTELDEPKVLVRVDDARPDNHRGGAVLVCEVGRGHGLRKEGEQVLGRELGSLARQVAHEDLAHAARHIHQALRHAGDTRCAAGHVALLHPRYHRNAHLQRARC